MKALQFMVLLCFCDLRYLPSDIIKNKRERTVTLSIIILKPLEEYLQASQRFGHKDFQICSYSIQSGNIIVILGCNSIIIGNKDKVGVSAFYAIMTSVIIKGPHAFRMGKLYENPSKREQFADTTFDWAFQEDVPFSPKINEAYGVYSKIPIILFFKVQPHSSIMISTDGQSALFLVAIQ